MAETTLLRSTAIVANAAVGTSRPPPVSTGALPLVQVKPVAPSRVQESQQQNPVTILPPKDEAAAVKTGGLPMVKVKMTDGKPKLDDGVQSNVVIKDNRNTVAAGGLPMVQVRMEQGRPQVQNLPTVQAVRPPIPSAAPTAVSQPRVGRIAAPQPVQFRPQAPAPIQPYGQSQVQAVAEAAAVVQAATQQPGLSIDQLAFVRLLVDKYLDEQRASEAGADTVTADNVKFAEDAFLAIERLIADATSQAPIEVAPVEAAPVVVTAPARAAVGYVAPAAYTQRPRTVQTGGYVAPRPGGHGRVNANGGNTSLAPRRWARAAGAAPLPTVQVKMDNGIAHVQNQAEIAAARQAELQAQAEALVAAAAAPQDPTPQQAEVLAARETQATPESPPTNGQG